MGGATSFLIPDTSHTLLKFFITSPATPSLLLLPPSTCLPRDYLRRQEQHISQLKITPPDLCSVPSNDVVAVVAAVATSLWPLSTSDSPSKFHFGGGITVIQDEDNLAGLNLVVAERTRGTRACTWAIASKPRDPRTWLDKPWKKPKSHWRSNQN